jgi:copper chaperone
MSPPARSPNRLQLGKSPPARAKPCYGLRVKTDLRISGMTCKNCVRHVDAALRGHRGVIDVAVDLGHGTATVEHGNEVTAVELCAAVVEAGYEGAPLLVGGK